MLVRIHEIVDDRMCYEKVPTYSSKKKAQTPPTTLKSDRRSGASADAGQPPRISRTFWVCWNGGQVRIWMLENVRRKTIQPLIEQTVQRGRLFYTDEYNIYDWLSTDYVHKTVNHSQGEYARYEDGDSKHEIHVNTMGYFWTGPPLRAVTPLVVGTPGRFSGTLTLLSGLL